MTTTLQQLNSATPAEALRLLDGLYEHSPWIAEQALGQRPFASLAALKHAMVTVLANATVDAQLGVGPTITLLRRAVSRSRPDIVSTVAEAPVRPDLTVTNAVEHHSVSERFAEVAEQCADSIALRTENGSVTYRDLARAASKWTAALNNRADPEAPLALIRDLDVHTAAVILGSFAAGAPLVPLDTGLPRDRVAHIVGALVERGYHLDTVITDNAQDPPVSLLGDRTAAGPPIPGVHTVTSIQFTSGSSGEPKAVLHTNGTWLSDWVLHRDRFGITEGRRVALCMPVSFAAGLNVLIGSLLSGAEVTVVEPRNCGPDAALDRIAGADIVMCTPSFLQSVTETAGARVLNQVQRIVTTGEPLYSNVIRRARELAPNAVLTNWAGSSETLGIAHHDIWPSDDIPVGVVPAGVPAPHKQLDIDEHGRLTVTSPYLAAGYLNPENATTEFIENPDGSGTFVTNDRARITDEGVLMILGRVDAAVKIRGYLVEPAEVEAALLECAGIREALVVADAVAGSPVLTAYVTPMPEERSPAVADVRAQLHTRLPVWTVPTNIVMLEALPRNERGKVDRQALRVPTRGPIEPPAPGLETQIACIWAEVLRLDEVGRNENFYALGGDSLNVQQMFREISAHHSVRLATSDLAGAPTVAQFAKVVGVRRTG
ncbi:MAG: AMP-binding protein, partial [Dietzia sp.]|nr:AMP-binding protein [Dietzia sp.]